MDTVYPTVGSSYHHTVDLTPLSELHILVYDDLSSGTVARLAFEHLKTAPAENRIAKITIWQENNFGDEAGLLDGLLTSEQFPSLRMFEVRYKKQVNSFPELQTHGIRVTSFHE